MVTGASSGLGEHFARILAQDGNRVVLTARRLDRLRQIAGEIASNGGVAQAIEMDVTKPDSVTAGFAQMPERLDVVVNNAGVTAGGPAMQTSPQEFGQVIDTDLKGVFHVAQAAAQRMQQDGGGAIINIASILGLRVAGNVAAYAAAKAAVIQLTKALALEWARYDIRVNALCPGYIETPLNAAFFASEAGRALIRRIPQRRLGQASDLNAPLRLLCSADSTYMTGAVIAVDGGHLISGL